jgi:hypothetical protein
MGPDEAISLRTGTETESMKLLYKPFGLLAGIAGGVLAGALFKRLWRAVADEDKAPSVKDADRTRSSRAQVLRSS